MKWWVALGIIAVGIAIAIGHGLGVGSANQVTYLVEPLRRAHVELFARDWFAMETTHYHGAFVDLATELFRVDDSGATAFGIAHVLATIATVAALHAVLVALGIGRQLSCLVILVGWIALGGSRALGGSYLVAGYFQPSSIATVAWLGALAFWFRDRHLAAGIALAVGGAFHANFLLLGIGWFGLLALTTRPIRPRTFLAFLGPSLVVLAAMLPAILDASGASEPGLALRILVEFHAPTHYDARVAIAQLPPLLGWLVAAWGCSPRDDASLARAWICALVGTALCTLVFLAILAVPSTTRLFVWRIAPFAQLASQIVILASVFSERSLAGWRSLAIPVGVGVVVGWQIPYAGLYTAALLTTIALAIAYRRVRRPMRRALPAIAGLAVLALAIAPVVRQFVAPDLFTEALGGRYRDAILWARTTDRDALFVVPPYASSFRLLARRAVVADSRSPPLYPDEMIAWYRRLCALVDVTDAHSNRDIEARYDRMSAAELVAAAKRFDAQYVVIDKQRSATRLVTPPAFEDWRVVVYAVDSR